MHTRSASFALALLVVPFCAHARGHVGAGANKTTFVLVRHGQTDYNAHHIVQGQANVPLNAIGREQAWRAAAALQKYGATRIIASPLDRARTTGRIIARALGIKKVEIDPRFKEAGFGVLTGLQLKQMPTQISRQRFKDPTDPVLSGRTDSKLLTIPGVDYKYIQGKWFKGESLKGARRRAVNGLRDLAKRHPGETILIASHSSLIELLLTKAEHRPPQDFKKLHVGNAEPTVFTVDRQGKLSLPSH